MLPVSYNSWVAEPGAILLLLPIMVVAVCIDASNQALAAASKRRINDRLGSE